MGSEYLKEKSRAAGLGFKPSEDPTLAGFYGAGDLSSNLVNPAGATRTAVKVAGKTGEAAKMLGNMAGQEFNAALMGERPGTILDTLTAPAQPKFIRRPAGGVFPTAKSIEEEPVSALDLAMKHLIRQKDYINATDEAKDAATKFMDTKLRDYFKTKASSVSDPVREALINGRIKIPKDSPLEEQFPQALLDASRAGDVTAMREIENRFDTMVGMRSYRVKKTGEEAIVGADAKEGFKQTILEQMKARPNIIPDEFLLRLAKKDTSKLSKQEQAAEVAAIRQKLVDNPALFNTVIEPKMMRLLDKEPMYSVSEESVAKSPDSYPALANAPKRQEGIMALNADVPITDLNSGYSVPFMFGLTPIDLMEQAAKIGPKELDRMSVPEFYAKAIPAVQKAAEFKDKVKQVEKLTTAGKPVPPEIGKFGTKEFLPTDQNGMTWREITDPEATLVQAKFLNNSIGGYATPGTYGPLNNGVKAIRDKTIRLFSLYDKDGNAVNNVEYVTPKAADDPNHAFLAGQIMQMRGNGVRTGNVVPEQYADQMLDLVNALNPTKIPPSITKLFQDNGLMPNPAPLPPTQRATGGMIERQPTDNRRYL
jgi:hypothetical protein